MAVFKALADNVQVNGETVLSVVAGLGSFEKVAYEILEANGIKSPQPGQWYSQQAWLNAFKEISEKMGKSTLNMIGKKIPENAKFPPEINDIHKALAAIDVAYHMNHKGGEIGYYKYEKTGERSATITCKNPYPTEFDKGIIEAMAQRFKPKDGHVAVVLDPASDRQKGGDTDVFLIKW